VGLLKDKAETILGRAFIVVKRLVSTIISSPRLNVQRQISPT
jgi:hypothetical protein